MAAVLKEFLSAGCNEIDGKMPRSLLGDRPPYVLMKLGLIGQRP